MKKLNVAYLRVSTEAQTEKYGLDMQRQKILDYCEKTGIEIDKWYIDGGYSGSKLDRPEIQKLLDDAESGEIGTVYIYKLDRMSRDVIDTLNLLYRVLPKYGVQVISMTEDLKIENPMDKVVIGVNAILGQYEREVIRMRMSGGMIERVKKGKWMGGGRVPFGYWYDRNDGILHIVEKEAEMVRNAYRLYLDGYSCSKIAKILGFKGERIVMQILKRKSNIGLIEYNGKIYQGLHEPIIDKKTFSDVQELMKRRSTNSHVANDNLLTGLCYCGECGARMRYQKWGKYHKLVCYSQQTGKDYMVKDADCKNFKPKADDVESEVTECFKLFATNVDTASEEVKSNVDIIEKSIKATNAKIKKLYDLYVQRQSDNLLEMITEEEDKLKSLENELQKEKIKDKGADKEKIEQIKNVSDVWDTLNRKEQNKILKDCVEKIVIKGENIEIYFRTFL